MKITKDMLKGWSSCSEGCVKGKVNITGSLLAGDDIKAGWAIKAGEDIKAGYGIEAGEGIEAGCGCGIFAGLKIRLHNWPAYARVSAKTKPENLVSGHWEEK